MTKKLWSKTLIGTVSFIATHSLITPVNAQGAEVSLVSEFEQNSLAQADSPDLEHLPFGFSSENSFDVLFKAESIGLNSVAAFDDSINLAAEESKPSLPITLPLPPRAPRERTQDLLQEIMPPSLQEQGLFDRTNQESEASNSELQEETINTVEPETPGNERPQDGEVSETVEIRSSDTAEQETSESKDDAILELAPDAYDDDILPEVSDLPLPTTAPPPPEVLRPELDLTEKQEASTPTHAEPRTYSVQPGDTLSSIARQTGISVEALAEANGINTPYLILVGDNLILSSPETTNSARNNTFPSPSSTSEEFLENSPPNKSGLNDAGSAPISPYATVSADKIVSWTNRRIEPAAPLLPSSQYVLPQAANGLGNYIWPTQGTLTSGYGWRWGRMHRGVDIAAPTGTPVVAAAEGMVTFAGWNNGGYGNLVDIRHADGSLTRYAHNSQLWVHAGQTVIQGQLIAEVGSTGYSTGPHLHFEIHPSGHGAVNPMVYLAGTGPSVNQISNAASNSSEAPQPVESSMPTYSIEAGDTLTQIAEKLDVSIENLVAINKISNPDFILAGSQLNFPVSTDLRMDQVNAPNSSEAKISISYPRQQDSTPVEWTVLSDPKAQEVVSWHNRKVEQGTALLPDPRTIAHHIAKGLSSFVWPAGGTLTSGFGWRWGKLYRGVDIAAPEGTPVIASADGVVVSADWNDEGHGNLIEIRHFNGSLTRYAHNHRLLVKPGQFVSQGEQIAEVGNTGFSSGNHLHFEIHHLEK